MFENSLYERYQVHTVATPTEEGDLFHSYEIKPWNMGPRIYKILGASVVVNLLLFAVFAQGTLLTMKGCDSPLVGGVCQVLDTVYVGALLFGSERDWVDKAYEKDVLDDNSDVEITFVDVSNVAPPLDYPEGYFQIANPDEYQAMLDAQNNPLPDGFIAPGIPITPPSTGGSLFDTTPNIPQQNPTVVDGDLPSGFGNPNPITVPGTRKGRTRKPPLPNNDALATNTDDKKPEDAKPEPTVDPTAPVADVEINKRPFVDLSAYINDLLDKNQVKLETPFRVEATGKIGKDGKLDPKTFKYVKVESADPRMIEVIKQAVEAMNASGYLQYLNLLEGKTLSFVVQQDDQNVTATIESQFENDLRPKTISGLFNSLISDQKEKKSRPESDQNDKDDLVLLQNATATPSGKKLVLSFTIPKGDLQQMVQRKLAEQKAMPKPQNINSLGSQSGNSNKVQK